jgi:hypothetical protein
VDVTKVGYFGDTFEFGRRHFHGRRKDRHHRVIDPDVDRPEPFFDSGGSPFDLIGVRHIGGNGEPRAAQILHFATGRFQALSATGNQTDRSTLPRKCSHGRSADTGRGPGNDNNFTHVHDDPCLTIEPYAAKAPALAES